MSELRSVTHPRLEVTAGPVDDLVAYGTIPSRYSTGVRLHPDFSERPLPARLEKNYDDIEPPRTWLAQFDVERWGLLRARLGDQLVGVAITAWATPGVDMLEGRQDLRVAPDMQGHGVGRMLFRAAEDWGIARGCTELKVETQDVNVPACRFYLAMGCHLAQVVELAYPELPDEAQWIWRKALTGRA